MFIKLAIYDRTDIREITIICTNIPTLSILTNSSDKKNRKDLCRKKLISLYPELNKNEVRVSRDKDWFLHTAMYLRIASC